MTTYNEVNKGLKNIIDYMKSIENVWNESRNLKLYDAFLHADEIVDKYPLVKEDYGKDAFYDLFHSYCEIEYDYFIEWMKENNIEDCRKYIGRTSSFYLTDLHLIRGQKETSIIYNLLDTIDGGYYSIDIDDNGEMIPFIDTDYYTELEQIEEAQEYMEYIASGKFLDDVKKYLHDAIEIADYIDSFKKNQIDGFTEYIEYKNSDIEYEREQKEKEENDFIEEYKKALRKSRQLLMISATKRIVQNMKYCT